MNRPLLSTTILIALTVLFSSWGATGHRKISECSSYSFTQDMEAFNSWVIYLADHASDADYRKDKDPNEEMRHYIDIDSYADFRLSGRIAQTLDSAYNKYGSEFVVANGILPWATVRTFDSLRECLRRFDIPKAKLFAADLGHYVGDGHMPLHITENYNGQLTGNTGIHSRYETSMINAYSNQINYAGADIQEITDVNQYVFDYLYKNYKYVDSVLLADDYAKSVNSNTSSGLYRQALWNKSKTFTLDLFQRASKSLAELIYTAWVQAGKPNLNTAGYTETGLSVSTGITGSFPNPLGRETLIAFTLAQAGQTLLQVRDLSGLCIETLISEELTPGNYSLNWTPSNVAPGMYYLVLTSANRIYHKKVLYTGK